MTRRLDPYTTAPALMKEWQRAACAITASLEPTLTMLVELRASQINGCANCLNLHTTLARDHGETDQRLALLPAWREAPCYTERERAALGWTEALTRLADRPDLDAAYAPLAARFTEEERVKLTLIINVINGWNRLSVGFGTWVDPDVVRAARAAAA
jgi:AhpD family alkylhydroperoxidase